MIVCPFDGSKLLLVLQSEHSRIAGWLAAHWGNATFAPPRPYLSMVLAAQEHDTGWSDWEIKPTLNDEGRPVDYIGSTKLLGKTWLDFYRTGIRRIAAQDAYAGVIASLHGDALLTQGHGLLPYLPNLSANPDAKVFIDEQEGVRTNLLDRVRAMPELAAEASEERLYSNFKLMETFDQLAQFVSNRYPFNSTARKNGPTVTLNNVPVPSRPGAPDVTLTIRVEDQGQASIDPYPFDVDPLPITFAGKVVPERAYAGRDDFLQDFYRAEPLTVTYHLHSGGH